jgi:hypothetical protein
VQRIDHENPQQQGTVHAGETAEPGGDKPQQANQDIDRTKADAQLLVNHDTLFPSAT